MLTQVLEKVSKSLPKIEFFLKLCPTFLKLRRLKIKNFQFCYTLGYCAVIPEGQMVKHTFETKNVRYYQSYESVTLEQYIPVTLFFLRQTFLIFKKGQMLRTL